MEKIPKFNKCRAFFKAVGLEKNPKLINVGPTFILDYRVHMCKGNPYDKGFFYDSFCD